MNQTEKENLFAKDSHTLWREQIKKMLLRRMCTERSAPQLAAKDSPAIRLVSQTAKVWHNMCGVAKYGRTCAKKRGKKHH